MSLLFRAIALIVTVAAILSALWVTLQEGKFLALIIVLPAVGFFWFLEIGAKPHSLLAAAQSFLVRILSALGLMALGIILFSVAIHDLSSPIVFESSRLNAIANFVRLVAGPAGVALVLTTLGLLALVKGFILLPRTRTGTSNG